VLTAAVRLPTSSIAAYEIGIEAPSPETLGLIGVDDEWDARPHLGRRDDAAPL
jgi:hypothetical protein